jgi:hypothetical protein
MDAQRWRLAMYASCAWFWERPDRVETAGALRAAVRAARLIDRRAGSGLEATLRDDLALIDHDGLDGLGLVDGALHVVGAPNQPGNPSARGLRATG